MDRREFIRRLVIASALGVSAVTGVVALTEKVLASQNTTTVNTLPLPTVTSQESLSSSSTSPSTDTTSVEATSTSVTSAGPSSSTSMSTTTSKSKDSSTNTTKTTTRTTTTTSSSSSSIPSGYILLAPLSAVSGKTYAYFTHPNFGSSILINYGGTWKAFSAVCTHAGCTVNYSSGSSLNCPCHPGVFSANNGAVLSGPPPSKLAEYDIKVINSNIYVGNTVIN